jgi:O-antigen ligase
LTVLQTDPGALDLDPGWVGEGKYATRRRRHLLDIAAAINFMLLLLFLLPARLIVPELTQFGRPALLVGLMLGGIWLISRLHPQMSLRGPQPLRWVVAVFLVAFLLSYAAGLLRHLTILETNATDRALIWTLTFLSIVLAAADGIADRKRLDDVIRVLVWCSGAMALIGLIESVLNIGLSPYLAPPGLEFIVDPVELGARGEGFFRVTSTTLHYIEFSTVMAISVPFAVHVARFGATSRVRQAAAISSVLILAAIPATLSRTGILALLVMAVVMTAAWSWRTRFNLLGAGLALMAAMSVLRPGLLGTVRSLFTNLGDDPSIEGRTNDYPIVTAYFAERPWLGRGPGTYVPVIYDVLDNQWLLSLVTTGIVGVAALAMLHIAAITLAGITLRRTGNPADRHLCVCLIAAQVGAMVVHTTFDSLSFTTFGAQLALTIGLTGAMWRLTHSSRQVRTTTARVG